MTDRNAEMKARLLATFRGEAQEHLEAITANLLALGRGVHAEEARDVMETTFREVHTLKGAARTVNQTTVESLCQSMETVLSRLTRGRCALSHGLLEGLRDVVDGVACLLAGREPRRGVGALAGRLEALLEREDPGAAPHPGRQEAPASAQHAAPADLIRLDRSRLDALMVRAEELLAPTLASEERVREAGALLESLAGGRAGPGRRPAAGRGGLPRRDPGPEPRRGADLREVESRAQALLAHLAADHRALSAAVAALLDELRRMRLTPASSVLDALGGMVRDLAAERGRLVEWAARGVDLEIDRRVLDAIKEPLIHLLRNAVDHGIEPTEVRVRAGKPEKGRVVVGFASLEGGRVEMLIEDDGRGIDLVQVRSAAVRARLVSADEAQRLPDREALDLIFRSGLSTAPLITSVSGHGLGMAIVKERVERLGGEVGVETRTGAGTSIRMILPTTIATFRGLLVRARGSAFLLPVDAVVRAVRVAGAALGRVEGREALSLDGRVVPAARLADLLSLPRGADGASPSRSHHLGVILRSGSDLAGVLVDDVLGDREVLLKDLRAPLVRVRHVAGLGLLGTGEGAVILRPGDLVRAAMEARGPEPSRAEPAGARRAPVVLVVDDSITTRTMEKNLLEAAGYEVRVAADGVEAWTAVKTGSFDLVISDVDMPRLDGFGLTERIREDRELADLPVVLVTALESREDKERGIEVGANAYVIKSSFDQSNLLEIIRRLV